MEWSTSVGHFILLWGKTAEKGCVGRDLAHITGAAPEVRQVTDVVEDETWRISLAEPLKCAKLPMRESMRLGANHRQVKRKSKCNIVSSKCT